MKNLKILTVILTALISIMSIPFAFMQEGELPETWIDGSEWAATVLGLLGLVAAFGLLRNLPWGLPSVLAVAVLQVVGSIAAVTTEFEGAAFGLTVSLALMASAAFYVALTRRATT